VTGYGRVRLFADRFGDRRGVGALSCYDNDCGIMLLRRSLYGTREVICRVLG
jgi:hypothetical protein